MDYYEAADITQVHKLVHGTKKGLYLGFGAINKIGEILDDMKPSSIGFITSPSAYLKCGLWETILEAMKARNIPYLLYDKIMTNPTTTAEHTHSNIDNVTPSRKMVVAGTFVILF